jgi:hypothetical protein
MSTSQSQPSTAMEKTEDEKQYTFQKSPICGDGLVYSIAPGAPFKARSVRDYKTPESEVRKPVCPSPCENIDAKNS